MKVLTIIESIGSAFAHGITKAISAEKTVDPVLHYAAEAISVVNPALGATIEEVLIEVGSVEQIATAVGAAAGTGANKLVAALPAVEDLILNDPLFKGKVMVDKDKFNAAIKQLASSVHDIAASFESAVQSVSLVPSVPAAAVPVAK